MSLRAKKTEKTALRIDNSTPLQPAEGYDHVGGLAITRRLSRRVGRVGLAEGKQCGTQHRADPLLSKPGGVLTTLLYTRRRLREGSEWKQRYPPSNRPPARPYKSLCLRSLLYDSSTTSDWQRFPHPLSLERLAPRSCRVVNPRYIWKKSRLTSSTLAMRQLPKGRPLCLG